jgi:radical SAM protein with 4Fe4S-binding SPASM domain
MKIFKFKDVLPQLFNLLVRRRFDFSFEMIPYRVEKLPLKKIANFFLAGLNQFIVRPRPFGYPVFAQVEPANICNLSCPLCLTASVNDSRPKALLSFDTFKKFIDEVGDYLLLIVLWNWGEPFLNPDIYRMIAYAKAKGIVVHSSTNGNVNFDEKRAAELVDSGLDTLIFGVDGATQEIYSQYRVGGRLEWVKENIRTILRVREEKKSDTPRLNLRFVVMQHNEHELPLFKKMTADLGVDYLSFKTVDLPPARGDHLDPDYVPQESRYRRYAYEKDTFTRKQLPFRCMRPWKRVTLDALGEIISCEYDYRNLHSFGNIEGESVMAVWKGKRATDFRRRFNFGWNDFYLCRDCTYKDKVAEDCTVERMALRAESGLKA